LSFDSSCVHLFVNNVVDEPERQDAFAPKRIVKLNQTGKPDGRCVIKPLLLHSVPRIVALVTVCANSTGVCAHLHMSGSATFVPAYKYWHMCTPFCYLAKAAFKCLYLYFFAISTVEESSQPTEHANKIKNVGNAICV